MTFFVIFDDLRTPIGDQMSLKWDTVLERIFDGFPGGTPDPRKSDRGGSKVGSEAQYSLSLIAEN